MERAPLIYNFCHLSYGESSVLRFGGEEILSSEGCQQGDPLGPVLFALALQPALAAVSLPLSLGYLDDVSMGGPHVQVVVEFNRFCETASKVGLILNPSKCECVSVSPDFSSSLASSCLPGFSVTALEDCELLGAPLFSGPRMDSILSKKVQDLERACVRLSKLQAHDALVILRNAISAPKLTFLLRTSPCFGNHALDEFDSCQRRALCALANCELTDSAWLQATVPVGRGGLGLVGVAALAPSAFLASATATSSLQSSLLSSSNAREDALVAEALAFWMTFGPRVAPVAPLDARQSGWHAAWLGETIASLSTLFSADSHQSARWLACQAPHSGDWLHALPITSIGLRLDDEAIRLAVGLRLGTSLCAPHHCHCGDPVDARGTHGLSCRRNKGRVARHAAMNDFVHRAFVKAGVPAVKEPTGLLRADGKRPDGCTLLPWRSGKCLAWDVTAPDTLARSYLHMTGVSAGAAAIQAARHKTEKYLDISRSHHFVPFALESMGPLNPEAHNLMAELGSRLTGVSGDRRETLFLYQRLSVVNQRFNAVAIRGCMVQDDD